MDRCGADHVPVVSMVGVSCAQEVELGVVLLICQDPALELGAYEQALNL